jgi:hypothetical protein
MTEFATLIILGLISWFAYREREQLASTGDWFVDLLEGLA